MKLSDTLNKFVIIFVFSFLQEGVLSQGQNNPGNNWGGGRFQGGYGGGSWSNHGGRPQQSNYYNPLTESQTLPACVRPKFTDGASLSIEKCNGRNSDLACTDTNSAIPSGWRAVMSCPKGTLIVKYPSVCTKGTWVPVFYSSCKQLLRQSATVVDAVEETNQIKAQCNALQVVASENFVFSCLFPGDKEETTGCEAGKSPQGTKAFLRCKPPFYSENGEDTQWICTNGRWIGSTKKALCVHSSEPNYDYYTDERENNKNNNPIVAPEVAVVERPCRQLKIVTGQNFMFSCLLNGHNEETEHCGRLTLVPSGSMAFLRCRHPYESQNGRSSQWSCFDGKWTGESKKVICVLKTQEHTGNRQPIPVGNAAWNNVGSGTGNSMEHGNHGTSNPEWVPVEPINPPLPTPPPAPPTPPPTLPTPTTPSTPPPPPPPPTTTTTPPTTTTTTTTNAPKTPEPESKEDGNGITCPELLSTKLEGQKLECLMNGIDVSITKCDTPLPVHSEARYTCHELYEASGGFSKLYRKCRNDGTWSGNGQSLHCALSCGITSSIANSPVIPLIISGEPTTRGQWPWHAAIFLKSTKWSYICGGTLISKKAILTAGHCVTYHQSDRVQSSTKLRIDLGKYWREEVDEHVQTFEVNKIAVHPSYSPYGYDSDIAIIVLKEKVKVANFVRPICYPESSNTALEDYQVSPDSLGTVVGWGVDERRELADDLQMAKLRVISPRECADSLKAESSGQIQTRSTTYCAGLKNGTNVCRGDSGGGMYFSTREANTVRWYLQGIVSVGFGEDGVCNPKQFSIFTRVGRYADWIVRTLSENDAQ